MLNASGVTIYSYNERDWLTNKVTPQGTLSYAYDSFGNVTSIRSANVNGIFVSYTWDALNRLESATEPESGATFYGYDAHGNTRYFTDLTGS